MIMTIDVGIYDDAVHSIDNSETTAGSVTMLASATGVRRNRQQLRTHLVRQPNHGKRPTAGR